MFKHGDIVVALVDLPRVMSFLEYTHLKGEVLKVANYPNDCNDAIFFETTPAGKGAWTQSLFRLATVDEIISYNTKTDTMNTITSLSEGKTYYVNWGGCTEYIFLYTGLGQDKCINVSDNYYFNNGNFNCKDGWQGLRETTQEEFDWLMACINADKYISKEEAISVPEYIEWVDNKSVYGSSYMMNKDSFKKGKVFHTPSEPFNQHVCTVTSSWKEALKMYPNNFKASTKAAYENYKRYGHLTLASSGNEEEFKVGDWVVITEGHSNWNSHMSEFIGRCVEVTKVYNKTQIEFKGSETWFWQYNNGHFRRAQLYEIPSTTCMGTSIIFNETAVKKDLGIAPSSYSSSKYQVPLLFADNYNDNELKIVNQQKLVK